jgi:hypothetical protein
MHVLASFVRTGAKTTAKYYYQEHRSKNCRSKNGEEAK